MKELVFQCTFLSDIVLNARTATEGNSECLDFVPGSNFLGIVAKDYNHLDDEGLAYLLFHSGKVRFGDAHPWVDGQRALRMPLAWFTEKGKTPTDGVWVHHAIPPETRDEHRIKGIQLKQVRSGYFLPNDGTMIAPEKVFAIKAAYDRETRRTSDGQLYGYDALRRNSKWQFSVYVPDNDAPRIREVIEKGLVGEHNLGRSRSAQYGRVLIEAVGEAPRTTSPQPPPRSEVVLYAESRWAFFDEYGQPNASPDVADLGLPADAKILWDKSQIRTVAYSPWNAKRRCRDATRICLEKGSVIVMELGEGTWEADVEKGVGHYKAEGLGAVHVNPAFLRADTDGKSTISLHKGRPEESNFPPTLQAEQEDDNAPVVLRWLQRQAENEKKKNKILTAVNAFVTKNGSKLSHISPSQWGQVREAAVKADTMDLLTNKLFGSDGLLMHGVSETEWKKRGAREILRKELEDQASLGVIYAVRLASAMQKAKDASSGKEN